MRLQALSFLFFLTFARTFNAMETTTELVNTQQAYDLCEIPLELIPKFLFPNSSWMLVRTALRLKATCTYFNTLLNNAAKKAIIATLFFDNSEFNENQCVIYAFANLSQREMLNEQSKNNSTEGSLRPLIRDCSPELYLFAGANVNCIPLDNKNSFLISVARIQNADDYSFYLDTLIKMGAHVNYQEGGGNTALHLAVAKNAVRCVELLLLGKADVTVQNSSEKKPHEWFDREHCYIKNNPEHFNRIQQLLNGSITVEESRKQPLPEFKRDVVEFQKKRTGSFEVPLRSYMTRNNIKRRPPKHTFAMSKEEDE